MTSNQRALVVIGTSCAGKTKFARFDEGRLRRRVRLPDGTFVDDIAMAWFPERK
jgi:hypothetical protein